MGEPDSYMIDFEPYRGGNPRHTYENGSKTLSYLKMGYLDDDKREEFCEKIYRWLKGQVTSIHKRVVIAIAPGHEKCDDPTGFMYDLAERLAGDPDFVWPVTDGSQQLIRTRTIPKQSQSKGSRSMDVHRGTIELNGNPDNSGKVVVILDDIWTSGCTLRVCEEVMLTTKPDDVRLFVIGKTVH